MPPVRVPVAMMADPRLMQAFDMQGGLEVEIQTSALTSVTSTGALTEIAPNEAIDLEMEEEHALEEDVLNESESTTSSVAQAIRSILAVKTGTVTYDIPMATDDRVAQWIGYLQGPFRKWYWIWLSRTTRYVPMFRKILEQYQLPRDLIFLAMIESGFSPNAYSWAHAAGPWQFMPFTGKRYGLEVGFWLDERRDFERATHAAARYLRKLYEEFGDWYLAWAAYNAGEARVETAIGRAGTRDFWKLSRTRHLRRETRHYVPKLLAAAIIAKQPERYGFGDVAYLAPFEWDVITVTTAVDLKTLASACGEASIEDDLKTLNPALRRYVTPPGRSYEVRVPHGRASSCKQGLAAIPERERITYRYHHVMKGETPAVIAKKYQTTVEAIVAFNHLESKKLRPSDEIVVPIPASKDAQVPIIKPPDVMRVASYVPEGAGVIIHRVEAGDSLWKIAQRYHVTVQKLRLWNGLWRNVRLQIGQKLRIYTGKAHAER
jgi:membrane-bound lytic murein transglycosylase D